MRGRTVLVCGLQAGVQLSGPTDACDTPILFSCPKFARCAFYQVQIPTKPRLASYCLDAGISAVTFYAADIFQRAGLEQRADQLATFREFCK